MSGAELATERRAARLLRWYPPGWRARYGDEFTQLLVDDMAERPRSFARTADVIRNGSLARFTSAGLAGDALDAETQVRASLVALGCALTAFMAFGLATWSQLTVGWQWSAPEAAGARIAMVLMSVVVPAIALLALLASLPIAANVCAAFLRRPNEARALQLPLLLLVGGLTVLILGGIHFDHGWPGTGGHPWAEQGLVPAGVARFFWASTLSVTSYWAHPGALRSFPAVDVGWMAVSPLALVATVVGGAKTLFRVHLSARALRYEAWVAAAAAAAMVVFLAGAGSWVVSGSPAPHRLFTVGTIDFIGVAIMSVALVAAFKSVGRALGALRHQQTA